MPHQLQLRDSCLTSISLLLSSLFLYALKYFFLCHLTRSTNGTVRRYAFQLDNTWYYQCNFAVKRVLLAFQITPLNLHLMIYSPELYKVGVVFISAQH